MNVFKVIFTFKNKGRCRNNFPFCLFSVISFVQKKMYSIIARKTSLSEEKCIQIINKNRHLMIRKKQEQMKNIHLFKWNVSASEWK